MKTLAEVSPAIPVGPLTTPGNVGAHFIITSPGVYYLTDNIVLTDNRGGVGVGADDVTLDLNGFTISGVSAGAFGVAVTGDRVRIRNGSFLRVLGNGIEITGDDAVVEDCSMTFIGRWGVLVTGANARIDGCTIYSPGDLVGVDGGGVRADLSSVVTNCTIALANGHGIVAANGVVRACHVNGVSSDAASMGFGDGVVAALIESCFVRDAAGVGIAPSDLARACVVINAQGGAYGGLGSKIDCFQ